MLNTHQEDDMGNKECQAKVQVDGCADPADGAAEQEGEDGEEEADQGHNQAELGDHIQGPVLPQEQWVRVMPCESQPAGWQTFQKRTSLPRII